MAARSTERNALFAKIGAAARDLCPENENINIAKQTADALIRGNRAIAIVCSVCSLWVSP
jgi:hypothetical protein